MTRAARRLVVETLEDRLVPSTWMVTSSSASGTGSLAWAVTQANSDTSPALVRFDSSAFTAATTISISATLTLSNTGQAITIDASGVGPVTVDGGGAMRNIVVGGGVTATI